MRGRGESGGSVTVGGVVGTLKSPWGALPRPIFTRRPPASPSEPTPGEPHGGFTMALGVGAGVQVGTGGRGKVGIWKRGAAGRWHRGEGPSSTEAWQDQFASGSRGEGFTAAPSPPPWMIRRSAQVGPGTHRNTGNMRKEVLLKCVRYCGEGVFACVA